MLPRQQPPVAGPEIDSDENDGEDGTGIYGVDDGFYPELGKKFPPSETPSVNGSVPRRGSLPPFPFTPPDYGGPGVVTATDNPRVVPDVNVYQHKKSLAQGET